MASSFRKGLGTLAQFGLPIVGGLVGGPAGAAVGGAAGGALAGKGGFGNAALGAAAGYGGAKLLGGGGGGSNFLSNLFGGGGGSTAPAAGGFSAMGAPGGGNPLSYFTPTGINPPAMTAAAGGGGSSLLQSPLAKFGLLSAGAGLLAGKSPKVPGLPPSVENYRNMVSAGGSPIGQLGQQKLTEGLNQNFQDVSGAEESAALHPIELQQQEELRQLNGMYKSLRPGTDPSTDTTYQRDLGLLNDRYATTKANTVAQLHRQVYNDYQGQQAQRVGAAGQYDEQTKSAMQQVAQWDVDKISTQFGVDYQDAAALKNFLLSEGSTLFNAGVAPQTNIFSQFLSGIKGGKP